MAAQTSGRLLLRIEDIDPARCTREFEQGIIDDLAWLGVSFDAPPKRQSEHVRFYTRALDVLESRGLIYPCSCARADIARDADGRCDPDSAPLHVGRCAARPASGLAPGLRLDMRRALELAPGPLFWREYGESGAERLERADPAAWGDVLLKRRDALASYHLAVVVDDDRQGVSDVVRGRDLFHATSIHRLLQELLDISPPRYRHHRLVRDAGSIKMSKSARSMALAEMRDRGILPHRIRDLLGFNRATPFESERRDQLTLAVTAAGDTGIELGAWEIS